MSAPLGQVPLIGRGGKLTDYSFLLVQLRNCSKSCRTARYTFLAMPPDALNAELPM
jgi:hypothetical protein